jgi:hypothetical protein
LLLARINENQKLDPFLGEGLVPELPLMSRKFVTFSNSLFQIDKSFNADVKLQSDKIIIPDVPVGYATVEVSPPFIKLF